MERNAVKKMRILRPFLIQIGSKFDFSSSEAEQMLYFNG